MKKIHPFFTMQLKIISIALMLTVSINQVVAQTLFSEYFETCSNSTLSTSSGCNGWRVYNSTTGASYWSIMNSSCRITGNYSLAVRSEYNYCDYGNDNSNYYAADKIAYNTFSTTGYNTLSLSFKWKCNGEPNYHYGRVCYSTNGTTWTNLSTQYQRQTSTQTATVTLPATLDNRATVYLGFRWINDASTVYTPGFVVDDIVVTGVATCSGTPSAPVAAAATNIATSSFTANWAASANASAYYLDVSTVNTFASFVTGYNNKSVGNVTTASVTGLTANTTYYYRVRAACTGTSGNSGTITVTTSPNYCTPTVTNDNYRVIHNFSTTGGTTNITNNATGWTGTAYNYYSTMNLTIASGGSFDLIVGGMGTNTVGFRIWIDYNNDGDFADTDESVFTAGPGMSTGYTGSVTIPLTASLGLTRLRIRSSDGIVSSGSSCGNQVYGEIEDYNITITTPAGASYGIYAPGAVSGISDCEIYAQGGSSTAGCLVCSPTSTGYTNVSISTFPVVTATNVSCTSKDVTLTSGTSGTWSGSTSTPTLTGTGTSKTIQYTSTGRKDFTLNLGSATWTDDFETDKGWAFSGTTSGGRGVVPTDCSGGSCISSNTPRSGSNVLYLKQCNNNSTSIAEIPLTLGASGTFSGYYKLGTEANYDYFQYKVDGGSWTNITAGCVNSWSSFSFSVSGAGAHTIYLRLNTDNAQILNGSKVIIDDVQCTNVVSGSGTYTGFTNMMMAPPSAGSISGTASGCPGAYNFASSTAGTSGFTYSWSINPSTSVTIASPTASSTSITFPSTTTTYTVTCNSTSECCGPLTAITYTTSIAVPPVAPTAAAASTTPCVGGSTLLSATAPANASFSWYDAATGGNLLGTGATYTISAVTSGATSYYAQATNVSGCPSATRTAVTVTGTATPTPTTSGGVTRCGTGDVTLGISSPVAGYTYTWYTGSCGGTLIQANTGTTLTPTLSATTTYYVSATAPGCNASACVSVTATINTVPTTLTWTGNTSGDWFNAGNWGASGCIPSCASDVSIPVVVAKPYPSIGFNAAGGAACKNMDIQTLTTLTFSDSKADLTVCGNFTHNGTITTANLGTITFNGTTAQTYTKTTGSGNLNNVLLNNTAATPTLTLATDMILGTTGSFTFQSGKVITGVYNLIVNNLESTAISGHSATKYVEGNLRRYVSSVATGSYDFPVGHTTKGYQLANITFTAAPSTITYLTANFQTYSTLPGPINLSDAGACNGTYNRDALNNGFWTIAANTANNNSGMYDMTLYNTNYTNNFNGYTIMSRHNGSATWALANGDGSLGTCTGSPITAVRRINMKGFSLFGTTQGLSPLPIELLFFSAAYNGKSVDVTWSTATEKNNDYFTVERSLDARNFIVLGKVPSKALAGNSKTTLNYLFDDATVKQGVYYYRLKQTDFDGKYAYSSIAPVTINNDNDTNVIIVKPNPTNGKAEIIYECKTAENSQLNVHDSRGRLVIAEKGFCEKGKNVFVIDLSKNTDGIYYITLTIGNKIYKSKILKNQ